MILIPLILQLQLYSSFHQAHFTSADLSITQRLIQSLSTYISFETVSNDHNYSGASAWLVDYLKEIGLTTQVIKCNEEKPIIVGTWHGKDPSLKSIMLNSHYDVVPVTREYWKTDPFQATLRKVNGSHVIFGRGSQDNKSLGVILLEAIRSLKLSNFESKRSIHLTFVPDEEIGGSDGMQCLVTSPQFKAMNVGLELDEGAPSEGSNAMIYYGERANWILNVTANGDTGHSSKFINNLAISKLSKFINLAELYRKEQAELSKTIELGKLTTINLVKIGGGTANNVVPDTLWAIYNIRVTPTFGPNKVKSLLNNWALKSQVKLDFIKSTDPTVSPNDSKAQYYRTILDLNKELNITTNATILRGTTDASHLRFLGIPSYGLNPCTNTPSTSHDHNEFITVSCLQEGFNYYSKLISKLSNLN
ncbi:Zn-dependent exopeptidase [Conidiobolus coronatus NRRL 28638]|uniref:N-acyl-aliphatic-L-amino acid amidohydrolase n=1 Tax=Conidiobolus coronatus (strain ATCC 28846 / CBS 209.66 / NRRL 28638) TaxID=796925 RepID=A0A137NUH8_CONC2|nr:Zn-dependent exopeptidase [Conidiobolus coronatus NRRL 28638]|eukprot:KXN66406.1 Zn-dependent exopeptidase [Conidiobolus coronatus NRRL 28638]